MMNLMRSPVQAGLARSRAAIETLILIESKNFSPAEADCSPVFAPPPVDDFHFAFSTVGKPLDIRYVAPHPNLQLLRQCVTTDTRLQKAPEIDSSCRRNSRRRATSSGHSTPDASGAFDGMPRQLSDGDELSCERDDDLIQ